MDETTEPTIAPERVFLTLPQAAAFLGMPRTTLYDYTRRGLVPAERTSPNGGRYMYHRAVLERFRATGLPQPPAEAPLPVLPAEPQKLTWEWQGWRFTLIAEPIVEPKRKGLRAL